MCKSPCEQRHDAELRDRTDEDIARALQDKLEVLEAQGHAHAEHDDAEQNGDPRHRPLECPRLNESDACDEDDEECHIAGDKIAELFECPHRCKILSFYWEILMNSSSFLYAEPSAMVVRAAAMPSAMEDAAPPM